VIYIPKSVTDLELVCDVSLRLESQTGRVIAKILFNKTRKSL
jgi:hypothetical protein